MRLLCVNVGSSTLKLSVVEGGERRWSTTVEDWSGSVDDATTSAALDEAGEVDVVTHRIVHGGPDLHDAVRVDDDVLRTLADVDHLAPLHNPPARRALAALRSRLGDVEHVACFDTTFHRTIPAAAATYALPAAWNERWRLRRYGFHGLSHAHAVRRAGEITGRDPSSLRIVSCHLGSGSSLCAVREGRSVDTTMGFTPLEGVVMSTRSGTVDPGLLLWLQREAGIGKDELSRTLEQHSGLVGLAGTGDVRELLRQRAEGSATARLGLEVMEHRLVRETGAMIASAGGLDVLTITGGIGQNSPAVRAGLVAGLEFAGVRLDDVANQHGGEGDVADPTSAVRVVVVGAAEDLQMARETTALLGREA